MVLLARTHPPLDLDPATITSAAMTSVDRLGFTLRLSTPAGAKATRINFPAECRTANEVRHALIAMVQQARTAS